MEISLFDEPVQVVDADAAIVFLFERPTDGGEDGDPPVDDDAFEALDAITSGQLSALRETREFSGGADELLTLHNPSGLSARRLVLVGCGKAADFDPTRLRNRAGAAFRALRRHALRRVAFYPAASLDPALRVQRTVEGVVLAAYEPDDLKSADRSETRVGEVAIQGSFLYQDELERGRHIAESQNFSRDLVNQPGNVLPPTQLAARAMEMAHDAGIEVEVIHKERLEELKMGALLGVAQGSAQPPVLIVARYRPPDLGEFQTHLGLVGKGVTFDTGGISIKPAPDMGKMKYDMAGAGAMLGAMRAIALTGARIPVTMVVPSVENMPGRDAIRPGDVLTSYSGKTIEVLNTDAEGRLILADALTYAKEQGCTHIVDAATLTGSVVVALGSQRVGVFSNDNAWQSQLLAASETAGEPMWPMPMDDEYRALLKSPIADLANIGPRWGGSITAARFLQEFADPVPWVHLDIAGTAWLEESKHGLASGPSGVAVRTLATLAERAT